MRTAARLSLVGGVAALVAVACVELPLGHTNYFDPEADSRITLHNVPDTVNSINETFTATITSKPRLPSGITDAYYYVVEEQAALQAISGGVFRVLSTVGLLPTIATVRAVVTINGQGPMATKTVVVRQWPASASLTCLSTEGCATVAGLGVERSLAFQLRDSLNFAVNLPSGDYRFGTVVSRSPAVVSVQSRPSAATILVRTESVGTAWIVLAGFGPVADSLQVQVVP